MRQIEHMTNRQRALYADIASFVVVAVGVEVARNPVPAHAHIERSRTQGAAAAAGGAEAKDPEVPLDIPEMSDKGIFTECAESSFYRMDRTFTSSKTHTHVLY